MLVVTKGVDPIMAECQGVVLAAGHTSDDGVVWILDLSWLAQVMMIAMPELTRLVFINGEIAAVSLSLPNLNELSSLIDLSSVYPAISNVEGTSPMEGNEPFRGVQNRPHWTSTSRSTGPDGAWIVSPFA